MPVARRERPGSQKEREPTTFVVGSEPPTRGKSAPVVIARQHDEIPRDIPSSSKSLPRAARSVHRFGGSGVRADSFGTYGKRPVEHFAARAHGDRDLVACRNVYGWERDAATTLENVVEGDVEKTGLFGNGYQLEIGV